jgi:hypothetical protein
MIMLNCLKMEVWHGRSVTTELIENPTWQEVRHSILKLDAAERTLLALEGWGSTCLLIGGGEGRFVVSFTDSERLTYTLTNDLECGAESTLLNIGGQVGNYPTYEVISKDVTLKAAEFFFEHNERDPTLRWRSD